MVPGQKLRDCCSLLTSAKLFIRSSEFTTVCTNINIFSFSYFHWFSLVWLGLVFILLGFFSCITSQVNL